MRSTLTNAKDDSHADDVVQVVREVFGKGNQFATKITYGARDGKPEDLLQAFRNSMYPRIVVTVDQNAAGPADNKAASLSTGRSAVTPVTFS